MYSLKIPLCILVFISLFQGIHCLWCLTCELSEQNCNNSKVVRCADSNVNDQCFSTQVLVNGTVKYKKGCVDEFFCYDAATICAQINDAMCLAGGCCNTSYCNATLTPVPSPTSTPNPSPTSPSTSTSTSTAAMQSQTPPQPLTSSPSTPILSSSIDVAVETPLVSSSSTDVATETSLASSLSSSPLPPKTSPLPTMSSSGGMMTPTEPKIKPTPTVKKSTSVKSKSVDQSVFNQASLNIDIDDRPPCPESAATRPMSSLLFSLAAFGILVHGVY